MSQQNWFHVQTSSDAVTATCEQTDMSDRILESYIHFADVSFLIASQEISDVNIGYVRCVFSVR